MKSFKSIQRDHLEESNTQYPTEFQVPSILFHMKTRPCKNGANCQHEDCFFYHGSADRNEKAQCYKGILCKKPDCRMRLNHDLGNWHIFRKQEELKEKVDTLTKECGKKEEMMNLLIRQNEMLLHQIYLQQNVISACQAQQTMDFETQNFVDSVVRNALE